MSGASVNKIGPSVSVGKIDKDPGKLEIIEIISVVVSDGEWVI
jgi:hypothetical protein